MLPSDSGTTLRWRIVSGIATPTTTNPTTPRRPMTMKLDFQPKWVSRTPPSSGATIGIRPVIDAMREKKPAGADARMDVAHDGAGKDDGRCGGDRLNGARRDQQADRRAKMQ